MFQFDQYGAPIKRSHFRNYFMLKNDEANQTRSEVDALVQMFGGNIPFEIDFHGRVQLSSLEAKIE